jgi:hypothetical protein
MRISVLLPLLCSQSLLLADVPSAIDRFLGSSRPDYNPAELEPANTDAGRAFAPFSPADSDLGVQEVLGEYKGLPPVRVEVSADFYWTDNAPAATPQLSEESWLWAGRIAASWQPKIAAGWFADIGVEQQWFRFDQGNATDFENFSAHVGVLKTLPQLDDLLVYGRLEYQMLTTGSFGDSDYSANRIRLGAQKVLYNSTHHQLSTGISAAFDLDADRENLQRNEYALDLSYTYFITDTLSATTSWRGAEWDFNSQVGAGPFRENRHDFNQVVGVELAWLPCRNSRVSTSLFFSDNNSNTPLGANDSQAWTAGLGFGATFEF